MRHGRRAHSVIKKLRWKYFSTIYYSEQSCSAEKPAPSKKPLNLLTLQKSELYSMLFSEAKTVQDLIKRVVPANDITVFF